ncbi:5-methylcytosine restriction system specificity protein McrC [Cellulosimicrobium sp. Marseille-Q8652]
MTTRLEITTEQARDLASLGTRLAGSREWWGASSNPTEEGDSPTAITVHQAASSPAAWNVRVNDAIGVITASGVNITVRPKIPTPHALALLETAGAIPRLDSAQAQLAEGESLWDLISRWYCSEVEDVLRRDLIRDYRTTRDILRVARGHIDAPRTVASIMRGTLSVHCEVQEFDADNPANRVLLAGLRVVSTSPRTPPSTAARAARAARRFDGVGPLAAGDLRVSKPRVRHYTSALVLARHILTSTARHLDNGAAPAWAFLLRTPEAIEEGVRRTVRAALPQHQVTKSARRLPPSTKTLNPDLVMDAGRAVGDVKYKIHSGEWNNSDLYQVVAFATGYHASHAAVLTFARKGRQEALKPLHVGGVRVAHLCWPADPDISPRQAADAFEADVRDWAQTTQAP